VFFGPGAAVVFGLAVIVTAFGPISGALVGVVGLEAMMGALIAVCLHALLETRAPLEFLG
jgi:hypothetical protein